MIYKFIITKSGNWVIISETKYNSVIFFERGVQLPSYIQSMMVSNRFFKPLQTKMIDEIYRALVSEASKFFPFEFKLAKNFLIHQIPE